MIYLLFIPVITFQIWFAFYLFKMRRDDKVMFRFCEVRSDMIQFIHESHQEALTKRDYAVVRWLIERTNQVTLEFDAVKHSFNLGSILRTMRQIDHSVIKPTRNARRVDNPEVARLYGELLNCTVIAFKAYTPFLSSRVMIKVVVGIAKLAVKVGAYKAVLWATELQDRWGRLRTAEKQYWIPNHC
ncbi:hypothetical protein SAMN06265337_0630 [Hymenobacter gelipurpurascens]|uniref:Uncharacterized protein n=1 Tax=Hymenobacter gelipurpurascens TaxID=89968 RepID=A0A212T852_9BACT|nr:hypothetical protein [Hymenobacter gelipurpurascens]SNC62237.1 hypothetical protein SAMN06265337_0630 [Hymenobacter gelipurpurascens]